MNGFQISPRMQQLMAYCRQLDSYEKSNEILKEMLQIEVSDTQIYREADHYGKAVEATVNEEPVLSSVKAGEVMYVEADGSMIGERFVRDLIFQINTLPKIRLQRNKLIVSV